MVIKMGLIISKNHLVVTNTHLSKYGGAKTKMGIFVSKNAFKEIRW